MNTMQQKSLWRDGLYALLFVTVGVSGAYATPPAHHPLLSPTQNKEQRVMQDGKPVLHSTLPKTVIFNQTAGDASRVSKIIVRYFSDAGCAGSPLGSYTTPNGTHYDITVNKSFGLDAVSAWNVGTLKAGIADMSTVGSMAVFLLSTDDTTPQANFTGSSCGTNPSFCCAPVTCTDGQCTSSLGDTPQNFTLKTTAAIGDPANGGVIGCQNTGVGTNLYDLIIPTTDNNAGIRWGVDGSITGANSAFNGAINSQYIINYMASVGFPLPTYAAGICSIYGSTGGFENWFLPAPDQVACLYNNRASLPLNAVTYWTSRELTPGDARARNFSDGTSPALPKSTLANVRCAQSIYPTNHTAYVTNYSTNSVSKCAINSDGTFSACNLASHGGPAFAGPTGIAINKQETIAYIANQNNGALSICPLESNGHFGVCTPAASTPFVGPLGLALNAANTLLYVTDFNSGNMVYSCTVNEDGSISACTSFGSGFNSPAGIVQNKQGNRTYINNYFGTNTSVCTTSSCNTPSSLNTTTSNGIALNHEGTMVYIVNYNGAFVASCRTNDDPASGLGPCSTGPVGGINGPSGVVVDDDKGIVYVVSYNDQKVFMCALNGLGVVTSCSDTGGTDFVTPYYIALTKK